MTRFEVGSKYSRVEVQRLLGVQHPTTGGPWGTGYAEHEGEFFIFANVGTAGRTGDDHGNAWDGADLEWAAKGNTTLAQSQVKRLLAKETTCHVFTRERDRDEFAYAGVGTPTRVRGERPIRLRWVFDAQSPARRPRFTTPTPSMHGAYRPANGDATIAAEITPLTRDPALLERAMQQHAATQNALARMVGAAGLVPQSPSGAVDYDLVWAVPGGIVLAEVKSLTATNEVAQIRHGLGQILDYRARLESIGDDVVQLVLALEREPDAVEHWARVCASVGVTLCWAPHFTNAITLPNERT
jgi:hypothetical protein